MRRRRLARRRAVRSVSAARWSPRPLVPDVAGQARRPRGRVARWRHVRRRARDPALVPHDPRRAAPVGPRGRRLGGRLPGRHRAAPGRPRGGARRRPLVAAARPARAPRAVRRRARRPRPGRGARHHPLAAPGVPRLLPGQHVGAGHPGRHRVERPRHPGHAVADRPGLHRGRDARARLGGRPARPARAVPVGRRRAAGSSRTRPRRPPCAPCWRRASGRSGRAPTSTGWWCTPRPRPTRRWRRAPAWPGCGRTRSG